MATISKGKLAAAALPLAALLLGACASKPGGQVLAQRDPLEKSNRAVFKFNKGVDTVVLTPATKVYRATVPKAAQRGVSNAFNNVDEPFSFINALLQGKVAQAGRTLARFLINTTIGVGGLADHATDMGLPEEPEDLGQTLAVWGVNAGPYLVLPILGPSTLRDSVGTGAEFLGADPYRHLPNELGMTKTQKYVLTGVEALDTRSFVMDTADSLLKGSADEYAAVRAAYLQFRESLVYDGAVPDEEELLPEPEAEAQPQPDPEP